MSWAEARPGLSMQHAPRSFLSFDFGARRIGVATGNTLIGRAQPLVTLAGRGEQRFADIARLIAQWQPDALIVGVPFHPDGAEHDNTLRARRFGRQLSGRFHLQVHEIDERWTTTEARSRDGGGDIDALAAAVILDQFLHSLAQRDDLAA
jgi:putative Holliday junction resolvase